MAFLERMRSPEDLKQLNERELRSLAEEIRRKIIETVKSNGGHMASNLGVIELTIALHRVFDSPKDAIVWDVGHQSYTHKLLTGRLKDFSLIRKKGGLSGFPKRSESRHDIFDTGHSSTSISSALGLLEARWRNGDRGKVIAVIGDGALTAGMAYEALSNIAQLELPLIIVLNDNRMSISPNVGALSRYLSRLSASIPYQKLRKRIDAVVGAIPFYGKDLTDLLLRAKRAVKAIFFKNNFFSDLGIEYVGPIDGHNIPLLTSVFTQVRRLERPVVIHVETRKGKGYEQAEEDPVAFHGVSPSQACTDSEVTASPTFTEVFGKTMLDLAGTRKDLVAITAAMSKGTGLDPMAKKYPSRVYDVGIAEQHAVTFAGGLAAGGLVPVVAVYSTFMQRAVDQVFHDLVIPGFHAILALDRAGAVGEDGETHQGLFDIPLFKSFPGMTIMAPADATEMDSFLRWAAGAQGPVMLRYPKARTGCADPASAAAVQRGRGVFLRKNPGAKLLVLALGPLAMDAAQVADRMADDRLLVDVYSLRFAAPLDGEHLKSICSGYSHIVTLEEGVRTGGTGESIAALLSQLPVPPRCSIMGFDASLPAQATREELLADAGLDAAGMGSTFRRILSAGSGNSTFEKRNHEAYAHSARFQDA
jgi:1-deoxy-D-xylulose-5-phosphate synthase